MNEVWGKNLGWKIISFLFAITLWLLVINTQNPEETKELKDVPIQIKNTDIQLIRKKGLVISNWDQIKNQTVKLLVRGPRMQLEKLQKDSEKLEAKIDISPYMKNTSSQLDRVLFYIPVEVSSTQNMEIEQRTPEALEVLLERERTVVKKITWKFNGEMAQGYVALEPTITPKQIEIAGPESLINQVFFVRTDVNVEGIVQDINDDHALVKVYDYKGNEIKGLLYDEYVNVHIPVGKKKKIPVEARFKGKIPDGYVKTKVETIPKEIEIVGNEKLVDSLKNVTLEPIELGNIKDTVILRPNVVLPKGIQRSGESKENITVKIEVKKQKIKKFDIPTSKLKINIKNLPTGLQFSYISKDITFSVTGIEEQINQISDQQLYGTLDLGGYEPGKHKVPIEFYLPPSVKISGNAPKIEIELIKPSEPIPVDESQEENE